MINNDQLLQIAIKAAKSSGEILVNYYEKLHNLSEKGASKRDIVTEIDMLSQNNIINTISKSFPDHSFLAEENYETNSEGKEFLWYVDPIDGTVNYFQGIPIFAISIALEVRGDLSIGVIYNPVLDELYYVNEKSEAYLNGNKISVSNKTNYQDGLYVAAFSSKAHPDKSQEYALFGEMNDATRGVLRIGSAAMGLAYLAAGKIDGFWSIDLFPWDVAAGVLLVKAAGGKVTDFTNNEYKLGKGQRLLATNAYIHPQLMSQFCKII